MKRRQRRANPLTILVLLSMIGAALYFIFAYIPTSQPLFIPTSTPTRAPETFIADAQVLAEQGKFNQAIAAYRQAIQADPKNPGNYINLARLLIYTGSYKDAAQTAENALLINANNALAHAVRGWALGFAGDYLAAEGALAKSLELESSNAVAQAYLAEVLALAVQAGQDVLGTRERAIAASRAAQQLAPDLMETHRARGIILELTANYEEAAREFAAAIAINPNIADLHLALGRNYRALQQYVKAIEEFNRANALNPSDPLPSTYISRTYLTVGDFPKAIQYAQQAIKVSPEDPFLYGNLGLTFYRNKRYTDAVEALRLAVRGGQTSEGKVIKGLPLANGRVSEFYQTYGLAQARSGGCNEALQISQLLQQGVPNDETAVFNAKEMVRICQEQVSGTATPTRAGPTATPAPTKKP